MSHSTTSGALAAQAARAIADGPKGSGKPPTEHHPLNWRGITMQVIYRPRAYGGDMPYDHIEVQTDEHRQPLPISETGYRSLFLPSGEVENSGGPVVFVKLWLDAKARSKTWKAIENERRQGRLF
jgi:hypothetical protein